MRAIQRRAPNAIEQQIGGHLEQEIGEEEHAGAEAEHRLADAEIGVHRQLGEADVDAVEIGDEVADDEKRYESPGDLGRRALFDVHLRLPPKRPTLKRASTRN